ncbi:peptidoglycan-binding protein [Streptomyces sp. TRM 70351]|uniref:peptidoglycan-binding protein n=1 Tax=Streptomyces sp. TRM 70351 TaxID=3116552 RepID=UPI002E7B10C2|nr:peptidoglycan-binding protein [Streptomyces sp. TRM 70351]MEE1928597.1 peptidoglycan-binding protein [Streptomyces sp. TRM 70351]
MPFPTPHRPRARTALLGALTGALVLASGAFPGPAAARPAPAPPPSAERSAPGVAAAFDRAARAHGVPRDLLVAVAYGETRLDGHAGRPSHANGYGVMHLVSNPRHRTLAEAAALTGEDEARLRRDTAANIRGGAAVLRSYADDLGLDAAGRRDVDAWYPAVARYGGARSDAGARLYADAVYGFLTDGLSARTPGGERVTVPPRPVTPERDGLTAAGAQSADYPSARWVPAHPGNYSAGRAAAIRQIVVHVTQGSYAGAISWFQDPASNVSAHYVIRSHDGEVTQTVRDRDTAYHARSANSSTLGIEHEGYVSNPSWFTDAMYRSSAALTRHLCDRYGIPKDRAHIVGHHEVPGNDHTDPGPHWDWTYYLRLVRDGSGDGGTVRLSFPSYSTLRSGSAGPQVSAAQFLLNQQGFGAGTVDGLFGSGTRTAVTAFQRSRGLGADGVVGARTWTALLAAGTRPLLREGGSGADVARLQRALTAALGRTVNTDGLFGPATADAVRDYQRTRGLTADGVVGPATWSALQSGR